MSVNDEPKPSISVTYRRVDGDDIADHGWVSDLDWFDEDEEPVELVEEKWTRTTVRTFTHFPKLYACQRRNCDEDAVTWVRAADGDWLQVCAEHKGAS
jgi:hypothetical protein